MFHVKHFLPIGVLIDQDIIFLFHVKHSTRRTQIGTYFAILGGFVSRETFSCHYSAILTK